jgi:hypothetical protein
LNVVRLLILKKNVERGTKQEKIFIQPMLSPDEEVFRIVSSLEGAACVIEAELEVINRDLRTAEDNCKRYGEVFLAPCRFLTQLRENKKLRFREIVGELEKLQIQLEASSSLVSVLRSER